MKSHYLKPYSRLPLLEKLEVRRRALTFPIIVHQVELLRTSILADLRSTDRARAAARPNYVERTPEGCRKPHERALQALEDDGVITASVRAEIVDLYDFRNDLAHRTGELFSDLSLSPYIQGVNALQNEGPDGRRFFKPFQPNALRRVDAIRRTVQAGMQKCGYTFVFEGKEFVFESSEKLLRADIRSLEKRIDKLIADRINEIDRLSGEILEGLQRLKETAPDSLLTKLYGRLTQVGVNAIREMFRLGYSDQAIAHLFQLSLKAVKRHRSQLH